MELLITGIMLIVTARILRKFCNKPQFQQVSNDNIQPMYKDTKCHHVKPIKLGMYMK